MDASPFDQRLEIETPERVVIVHDLAGIGSRFAAGLIDACVLLIPWCAAICVAMVVVPASVRGGTQAELQAVGMAVVGVCTAITWLYYLASEAFWGGRTVGKRMLRLRVMSVHGGPAPVSALLLRNILRVVDSLPTLLLPFVGGLVMFLTSRSQRIGDLVAGTVVVRERPESLHVAPERGAGDVLGEEISAADLAEVQRFLERRDELVRDRRAEIAALLFGRLRTAYRLPHGDPETVLGLLAAHRTPQEIRDLAAPSGPPAPRSAWDAGGSA